MSNFKVGDKVLCINDTNWRIPLQWYPICGEIYTIRGFISHGDGVLLEEIVNPMMWMRNGIYEPGFLSHRFIKWNPEELIEEIGEEVEVEESVGMEM